MKCLTISQPHATLIMLGVKMFETRSWRTYYKGDLAIHAGLKKNDLWLQNITPFKEVLKGVECPIGAVLGICRLVYCTPTSQVEDRTFGDFGIGRWAFRLEVLEVFDFPVPAKGSLGIWDWPFNLELGV